MGIFHSIEQTFVEEPIRYAPLFARSLEIKSLRPPQRSAFLRPLAHNEIKITRECSSISQGEIEAEHWTELTAFYQSFSIQIISQARYLSSKPSNKAHRPILVKGTSHPLSYFEGILDVDVVESIKSNIYQRAGGRNRAYKAYFTESAQSHLREQESFFLLVGLNTANQCFNRAFGFQSGHYFFLEISLYNVISSSFYRERLYGTSQSSSWIGSQLSRKLAKSDSLERACKSKIWSSLSLSATTLLA